MNTRTPKAAAVLHAIAGSSPRPSSAGRVWLDRWEPDERHNCHPRELAATAGQATKPATNTPNFRDDLRALAIETDHERMVKHGPVLTKAAEIRCKLADKAIGLPEAIRQYNQAHFGGPLPTEIREIGNYTFLS